MIAFDFEYYQPKTADEAIELFQQLDTDGKSVMYYGGGTEFISRARINEIHADAIIDVKGIPECNQFHVENGQIKIGAAVTLSAIEDAPFFPLLSSVVRLIATKTARNKITIGGNIAGNLPYSEAILPFLLADSKVILATNTGEKTVNINELFNNGNKLKRDEFILAIWTDEHYSRTTYFNLKRTKHSHINYPLVSIASFKLDQEIRIAFSGVCSQPFRLKEIETILNDQSIDQQERAAQAIKKLPEKIREDMHASESYRKFLLHHALLQTLEKFEGVS